MSTTAKTTPPEVTASPVATSPAAAETAAPKKATVVVAAPKKPAAKPVRAKAVPVKPAKPAKPAAPPKAAKPVPSKKQAAAKVKVEKQEKPKKPKLVRDSFTIPKTEYLVLEALKQRAVLLAQPAKKSELLRAGIKALAALSDADLRAALQAVPAIKTGRPAHAKAD